MRSTIDPQIGRREFLATGGVIAAASLASHPTTSLAALTHRQGLKVAAVFTEFTYRSHAHVILENFLEPYLFNGRLIEPQCQVVSFYADQRPPNDMAGAVAKQYGITMYETIADALTLGDNKLAVDAVLSIGEHGSYPVNEKGQTEYPRKRFFDAIVDVFERSGRVVPVFSDKHLSYRWDWAKAMYDTTRRLNIPFMAGSSVPLAQRRPPCELPANSRFVEAVSIHGGSLEGYDFHALEVLQSLVESRAGGETGIASVQFFEGDRLWEAARQNVWSTELARAAMETELETSDRPLRQVLEELSAKETMPDDKRPIHGTLVTYRDGLRALVLGVGSNATRWNFACRLQNEEKYRATRFYTGPWNNRNLFKALAHAIQHHFQHGKPPYPIERTLLVSGALDALMDSRHRGGAIVETPHLAFGYAASDFCQMREMGASWRIITEEMPEPRGIDPGAGPHTR